MRNKDLEDCVNWENILRGINNLLDEGVKFF